MATVSPMASNSRVLRSSLRGRSVASTCTSAGTAGALLVVKLSAEHGELKLSGDAQSLKIGDKIEIIPGYADFTTVLHDLFYGFRDDRLDVVWPIQGRGKLQ